MQLSSKVFLTWTALSTSLASANPVPGHAGHETSTGNASDSTLASSQWTLIDTDLCKYPPKVFHQQVNHNDTGLSFAKQFVEAKDRQSASETFPQRFQLIDEYFRPGGPIFFMQGGEAPMSCVEVKPLFLYAAEIGALVVSIEHRWFGESYPAGLALDNDIYGDPSPLAPLTLSNTLLDSVKLVQHIKSTVSGARNSKVIAFGGSYSGTLVALLRLHFPDVFFGAFSSSGLFSGLVSDPHDPHVYGWYSVVSQVFEDASANAAAMIRRAFQDLRKNPTAVSEIRQKLVLDLDLDDAIIVMAVASKYAELVQFDSGTGDESNINALIKKTLDQDEDDTIGILSAVVPSDNLFKRNTSLVSSTSILDETSTMLWTYIVCTYLPFPALPYSEADSIWGSLPVDESSSRVMDGTCHQFNGMNSMQGGFAYQRQLGLDQASLENSSRIFFTLGERDPASDLGPKVFRSNRNEDGSRVYAITGGAHCEEMGPVLTVDKVSVNDARLAQMNTIKEWLGMHDLPDHYPAFASKENIANHCELVSGILGWRTGQLCLHPID